MKARSLLLTILLTVLLFIACTTVPITERQQLRLVSSSEMMSMSYQQYDKFMQENKLSRDKKNSAMVKQSGTRIQKAVENHFAQKNMGEYLKDYKWEFNLVENDKVNAWCMPGGKVVVYTGILLVTKDETGMATVMAHEIAHAVAEHGNERMSQQLLQQLGGTVLEVAMKEKPQQVRDMWLMAYGVGTQVGAILPYSRVQETEADHLGLLFMAMAGYDPEAAVDFWTRMSDKKGGKAPPEILSTHPSDQIRISNLKKFLPEAMKYYKK